MGVCCCCCIGRRHKNKVDIIFVEDDTAGEDKDQNDQEPNGQIAQSEDAEKEPNKVSKLRLMMRLGSFAKPPLPPPGNPEKMLPKKPKLGFKDAAKIHKVFGVLTKESPKKKPPFQSSKASFKSVARMYGNQMMLVNTIKPPQKSKPSLKSFLHVGRATLTLKKNINEDEEKVQEPGITAKGKTTFKRLTRLNFMLGNMRQKARDARDELSIDIEEEDNAFEDEADDYGLSSNLPLINIERNDLNHPNEPQIFLEPAVPAILDPPKEESDQNKSNDKGKNGMFKSLSQFLKSPNQSQSNSRNPSRNNSNNPSPMHSNSSLSPTPLKGSLKGSKASTPTTNLSISGKASPTPSAKVKRKSKRKEKSKEKSSSDQAKSHKTKSTNPTPIKRESLSSRNAVSGLGQSALKVTQGVIGHSVIPDPGIRNGQVKNGINGINKSGPKAIEKRKVFESKSKNKGSIGRLGGFSTLIQKWKIKGHCKWLRMQINLVENIIEEAMDIRMRAEEELIEIIPVSLALLPKKDVPDSVINLIRTMRFNPPRAVQILMASICILKGIEPIMIYGDGKKSVIQVDYWGPSKKLLASNFADELNEMKRPGDIKKIGLEEFNDLIKPNPTFDREKIQRAFSPCTALYDWILQMEKYGKVAIIVKEKEDIRLIGEITQIKAAVTLKSLRHRLSIIEEKLFTF